MSHVEKALKSWNANKHHCDDEQFKQVLMVLEAYRRKPLLDIDNMISPEGAFRVIKLNGGGLIETTTDLKVDPIAYVIGSEQNAGRLFGDDGDQPRIHGVQHIGSTHERNRVERKRRKKNKIKLFW